MGKLQAIPRGLVETIGRPIPRVPKLFCGGNDFLKRAAGITIVPIHPPEHFGPQNHLQLNQPEQGAN